ncbi:hypothetical protein JAAARDRAFT_28899 [Jaapia argillacea MUCL 33604]|uniref:Uncharacterized protein n=1 Tax=Jaapia argillacea MUCL 33604 TaxID=933084 RepID=A0A067QK21_9AGAM|nr:hypothetical protein JAAARDRAFT_28899 [Jaapia argillacea MUCL 33604]
MRLLLFAQCLVLLSHFANANTEIVNFSVQLEDNLAVPGVWPSLHYGHSEEQWTGQPAPLQLTEQHICKPAHLFSPLGMIPGRTSCSHEIWTMLDLDQETWRNFSKFTLRISYPASSPTEFSIKIFSPSELHNEISTPSSMYNSTLKIPGSPSMTRRKYARIRLSHTGVSIGSPQPPPVTFNVILEPLYFQVLPASVIPILSFLVPLVVIGIVSTFPINRFFRGLAESARSESRAGCLKYQ